MSRESWREALDKLTLWDLPIGVYVVDHDGTIVEHNEQVKEFFGRELVGTRVEKLYPRTKRSAIFSRLLERERPGSSLQKEIQEFNVDGKKLFAMEFARTLRHDETGQPLALLCCLVDYTSEHRYRRLFDRLPAGFYRLDARGRLVDANARLAEMYGFQSIEEALGRKDDNNFLDPQRARDLRHEIQARGEVIDFRAELVKQNGDTFWASIFASAVKARGRYSGREGAIFDVTREEQYAELIEEMPLGLYRVRRRSDEELIEHCNRPFAEMVGAEKPSDLTGKPIGEFHRNLEQYAELLKDVALEGQANRTLPLAGNRWADVHTRAITKMNGEPTGVRVGGAVDVTERHEQIGELREDIGKVLHTYSSTLISLEHAITPVAQLLGRDPFTGRVVLGNTEPLLPELEPVREELVRQLKRLVAERHNPERAGAFSASDWEDLQRQLSKLYRERVESLHPEARYAALRQVALQIVEVLARAEPGHFSRQAFKASELSARELARLTSLLALHLAQATITEMSYQVRALREFVTSQHRFPDLLTDIGVDDWVSQAVGEHAEYARSRGVTLRPSSTSEALVVRGSRRDLVRCLGNIVHNAIKYSWFKTEPRVRIDAHREAGSVVLKVQNDGVPIHPEELKLVFSIGFRGRFAPERRRSGTGIGLADSFRVARSHGGTLTVESLPPPGSRLDNFHQPFVTTFTLTLPATL